MKLRHCQAHVSYYTLFWERFTLYTCVQNRVHEESYLCVGTKWLKMTWNSCNKAYKNKTDARAVELVIKWFAANHIRLLKQGCSSSLDKK